MYDQSMPYLYLHDWTTKKEVITCFTKIQLTFVPLYNEQCSPKLKPSMRDIVPEIVMSLLPDFIPCVVYLPDGLLTCSECGDGDLRQRAGAMPSTVPGISMLPTEFVKLRQINSADDSRLAPGTAMPAINRRGRRGTAAEAARTAASFRSSPPSTAAPLKNSGLAAIIAN